jgi:hypothetical protein
MENELGGWPVLSGKDNELSSAELMIRLNKNGILTVFYVGVGSDPKNTKSKKIKVYKLSYKIAYLLKLIIY